MPTNVEVVRAVSSILGSEKMLGHFYDFGVSELIKVFVWGSETDRMIDWTPYISKGRFVNTFMFSIEAAPEDCVFDVSLEITSPYSLRTVAGAGSKVDKKGVVETTVECELLSSGRFSEQHRHKLLSKNGEYDKDAKVRVEGKEAGGKREFRGYFTLVKE